VTLGQGNEFGKSPVQERFSIPKQSEAGCEGTELFAELIEFSEMKCR